MYADIIRGIGKILIITGISFIPVLLVWVIAHNSNRNQKVKEYLNFSISMLVIGFVVMLITGFSLLANIDSEYSSDISNNTADGFTIENYNVKLKVNDNNSVDVTEELTINFYEEGHHGIYKVVPRWLEYTPKDGKTISRESKIKNLKAIGEEYSLDKSNGKDRIKIGSANYTLPIGNKTYTITYQYDMGNDPFDGYDEFIFHAYGDYWGTRINNASLEITMPKNFDENSIKFFNDKNRNNDITSIVDYYVLDNKIFANVDSDYDLRKSLTIDVLLPEGYFVNESNNYGFISLIMCISIVIISIIVFMKWLRYGKDNRIESDNLEFNPPEGLDAASIGYIYKKESGVKLAISIIFELASKGFIRIDETEDKKVKTITNLCPIDIDSEIKRKVVISKIKDARSAKDKKLMEELFSGNKTNVTIKENIKGFYSNCNNLISKGYIKIESDSIGNYTESQLLDLENSLRAKAFNGKPNMTSNEKIVFDKLFENGNVNVLSEDKTFYQVFSELSNNLKNELDDKINDIISYKNMAITSILFFISTVYFIFAFSIVEDLNPNYKVVYIFAFISIIITFIMVAIMDRKSDYGENLYAKIEGFKKYIEITEKDKIDSLSKERPNYFYEILPYAYVLGVSKTWVGKYENVPKSIYEMGNFDYCDMNSYVSLSNSVYYPSSSGSSSSGGCSSCGGGCSSCGGGGSW